MALRLVPELGHWITNLLLNVCIAVSYLWKLTFQETSILLSEVAEDRNLYQHREDWGETVLVVNKSRTKTERTQKEIKGKLKQSGIIENTRFG